MIKGYVAVVDQVKLGLPISAFASIKLERQREEDSTVSPVPSALAGGRRLLPDDRPARLSAADRGEGPGSLRAFLKDKLTRLEGVASIESSFALGQVKHAQPLPIE